MPPVLDPSQSQVDGLAFLGLSLARKSERGHPNSATHQTAFDWNEVIDRDYRYLFSTNDDGWLVGGGEPGPPVSYKLAAPDSAHVEIMRLGTYRPEWGGVSVDHLLEVLQSGQILIPHMEVVPTAVVANQDRPPELEIRFDMEPPFVVPSLQEFIEAPPDTPLPINWALRFVHNQLFMNFHFPSRFCPGAFHSTIVRKAEFRSRQHRLEYFQKCQAAVSAWKRTGPQPLIPTDLEASITPVYAQNAPTDPEERDQYRSGLWLFTDRENITHWIAPNFLPPYNTPEKRRVLWEFLSVTWDEAKLGWKPAMGASTPRPVPAAANPHGEEKKDDREEQLAAAAAAAVSEVKPHGQEAAPVKEEEENKEKKESDQEAKPAHHEEGEELELNDITEAVDKMAHDASVEVTPGPGCGAFCW